MRRWLVTACLLAPLSVSTTASADECPPGSWFCEEVKVEVTGPVKATAQLDSDDAEAEDSKKVAAPVGDDEEIAETPEESPKSVKKKKKVKKSKKKVAADADGPDHAQKTVEVEADDDTVVIVKKKKRPRREVVVVEEREERAPARKKTKKRWRERFGLNLRLEGAAFASADDSGIAGMGGVGASFRWRPIPWIAFDLGADLIGGSDYHGNDRIEVAGSLSGLVYFNPQHRVQVYGIGGVHLSHAEVDTMTYDDGIHFYSDPTQSRNYFGGHGGLGLEFRIARHFGMFVDGLAIIRHRIDSDQPEFVSSSGQTTNTSAGALFRTGVNFWW